MNIREMNKALQQEQDRWDAMSEEEQHEEMLRYLSREVEPYPDDLGW